MKRDILNKDAEGVFLAIAKKTTLEGKEEGWFVYLINENDHAIDTVLINTKGYGFLNGQEKETSNMRYHIEKLEPNAFTVIEPIDPNLFQLNNEYWTTYFMNGHLFDKKFIFPENTIKEENLMHVPQIDLKGILHI